MIRLLVRVALLGTVLLACAASSGSSAGGYHYCCPVWSHDGTRIAVVRVEDLGGSGPYGVFLANVDGSRLRVVPGVYHLGGGVSWSPDDRLLAANQGYHVVIVALDGTIRLTLDEYGHSPRWSPGGRRIAYVKFPIPHDGTRAEPDVILAAKPDRSGARVAVRGTDDWSPAFPAWSPDGQMLAFTPGAGFGLIRNFGGPVEYLRLPVAPRFLAWSPDGKDIAFESEDRIGLLDLKSRRVRFLRAGRAPAWSPNGSRLVFQGTDYAIYVMNRDGSHLRRLNLRP